MMLIKKIFYIVLLIWSINGCASKAYVKQESLFIVFKTPAFKHADLGFVYTNADEMKIEMYSNGQAMMAFKIGHEKICMSWFKCLDKKSFNRRMLSEYYPVDILRHIFRGEEIFSGEHKIKRRNGFTQKIVKSNKYNINYSVLNKQIIFRDTINNILIKIKRLGV